MMELTKELVPIFLLATGCSFPQVLAVFVRALSDIMSGETPIISVDTVLTCQEYSLTLKVGG